MIIVQVGQNPADASLLITFEDRASDSPVVDRVWRSHSDRGGPFQSMASPNWGMVVTRLRGETFLTVRGPETMASIVQCPAEGEWVGVQFKVGTCMPLLATATRRDRNDLQLPGLSGKTFALDGSAWEYPSFDNIDSFVKRLVGRGLIVTDPHVRAVLLDQRQGLSRRTEERRFRRVTGLTRVAIRQIERARSATLLLLQGRPATDVAYELGYVDQAHMTRSLARFVGQTPGQIHRGGASLSLLYNPEDR